MPSSDTDMDLDEEEELLVAPCPPSSGSIFGALFGDTRTRIPAAASLLSRYLIDRSDLQVGDPIGKGSSGIVYKGSLRGNTPVAIKVLNGAVTAKGSKTEGEFRREVLGLISCAHRNVLKLYGICLSSTHGVCIVTKFMQGGSLLQYLVEKTTLTTKEIIKLAKDVAKGMRFLHSRGIVHMDLKTANVFLDEEGNAVIGDLGVSRLASEKDGEGIEIGTYRWMAPEVGSRVISGSRGAGTTSWFSYKTDVYSFGILLWELVTCKLPYIDYSPVQAAVGVVMHGLRPTIPTATYPPLRYLIQKCWDQSPSNRPHFSKILQMLDIISLHEKISKP